MSPLHILVGRPVVLDQFLGRQSLHLFVHLQMYYMSIWQCAQFRFCVSACLIKSSTPVFCLKVVHGTSSWSLMYSIFLFIDRCVCSLEKLHRTKYTLYTRCCI